MVMEEDNGMMRDVKRFVDDSVRFQMQEIEKLHAVF